MNSPLTADDNFVITNPLDKGVGIPLTLPPPFLIILSVTAVGAVTRTSAFDLLDLKMKLDALYSELTLKPSAKLALLVLDGVGDLAVKSQGYTTPLEAAATPNLDALCKDSAQGRMMP